MAFPDVDLYRKQVQAITDRETKALVRWADAAGLTTGYDPLAVKRWALHTLAEHYRAGLVGIDPNEATWPADHRQVLADLEAIADNEG